MAEAAQSGDNITEIWSWGSINTAEISLGILTEGLSE